MLLIISAIPLVIGLGAVHLHPEFLNAEYSQRIIPALVSNYLSIPIQILFFGALISAILSTSSGGMLAPATIIGENLLKPYLPKDRQTVTVMDKNQRGYRGNDIGVYLPLTILILLAWL